MYVYVWVWVGWLWVCVCLFLGACGLLIGACVCVLEIHLEDL